MLDTETAWQRYLEGTYGLEDDEVGGEQEDKGHAPKTTPARPDKQRRRSASWGSEPPTALACHESECGPLYISTKTKIGFLNQTVPLDHVFWQIPVAHYHLPAEGVIKKQMKFNCGSQDTLTALCAQAKGEQVRSGAHLEEHVLTHLENPGGRIPFKDVRKISVGLCKKDVTSYRAKRKGAFYNCFVVILRLVWERRYKEIHVKVFNTGKLEIPGIRSEELLEKAMALLTRSLAPLMPPGDTPLAHMPERSETVLVNSNFSCGFHIDRQKLFGILRGEYNISCSYDPCSYPGIQAEFYYDNRVGEQTGKLPAKETIEELMASGDVTKVSFMIFRTGSVLIVGKCCDDTLREIYAFICTLLTDQSPRIRVSGGGATAASAPGTPAPRRARKRTITVQRAPSSQAAS